MALEAIAITEPEFLGKRLGRVMPGEYSSLPIYTEEGPEILGVLCFQDNRGGEIYSLPDPDPEWIEFSLPVDALKEENLEACVWPDEAYKRRISNGSAAALLVIQIVQVTLIPER